MPLVSKRRLVMEESTPTSWQASETTRRWISTQNRQVYPQAVSRFCMNQRPHPACLPQSVRSRPAGGHGTTPDSMVGLGGGKRQRPGTRLTVPRDRGRLLNTLIHPVRAEIQVPPKRVIRRKVVGHGQHNLPRAPGSPFLNLLPAHYPC